MLNELIEQLGEIPKKSRSIADVRTVTNAIITQLPENSEAIGHIKTALEVMKTDEDVFLASSLYRTLRFWLKHK